ncbi:MAG TPA: aldehyde dehydrogenase (NADP(+)) [Rhizomicrobium sp.]|jgi:NADP-dependent aldehyde dehydrogenase
MTLDITGSILIGNRDVTTQKTLTAFNPATEENLAPAFFVAGENEVSQACDLAWQAYQSYRQIPLERRAEFLTAIGEEIMAMGDALLDRVVAETGLARGRMTIERARTVSQLNLFARVVRDGEWLDLRIDTALPDRQPIPRPDLRLRQIPLGPVAVFGSSNFPLAFSVAGGDTASALAAGCPVVVKGHPAHLGTGELVARAVREAARRTGMPEGVFSYLPGEIATGVALVRHPHIKAVGFTGSRGGGLALCKIAAERPEPIPVYAEMSSVNPVFILPSALKNRAAGIVKGYVGSLTQGAGQFCTNPGLIFVLEGPELDPFIGALEVELGSHEPAVMLTKGIRAAFEKGRDALASHADVTTIAQSQAPRGPNRARATIFMTDVDSFLTDEHLSQEVFGAVSLIIRCENIEEMSKAAAQLEGQLTATFQMDTDDIDLAAAMMPVLELKAGRIMANDWPTGVEVADAMVHGGPFPATSDSRSTSVGTLAIRRFLRPVSYQSLPTELLPVELREPTLPYLLNGIREGR